MTEADKLYAGVLAHIVGNDETKTLDALEKLRKFANDAAEQRDHVQAICTAQLIELRALKQKRTALSGQVEAFRHMADQKSPSRIGWPRLPHTPELGEAGYVLDEKTIRLAAKLVVEEAMEFAEAIFGKGVFKYEKEGVEMSISCAPISTSTLDFPEAVDALADVDYVSEWARQALGIFDGTPIADEVQRANVAKQGGPVDPVSGKKLKPPGWTPPDIAGVLRGMGWAGQ